ncbi:MULTISPECIES: NAD(P)/FAD-dependent oxidoreductase [unclassified Pseudomonas]|uniref:NAD(P)/FAD-dependent oxidoreductase n=1 Tax=unclassified Pseudomonas TaxID=196821 RepID=UPI0022499001|nr:MULTISPECIES: NAD(P)/FAD-dependent oxidoreductase [unclassified Pseudomonas]MCX2707066.1 NAD(P)/FAD-dependent oxidoreductase [Pseudomonas sp. DCB_BG]MCX2815891.1 NAD(P)/FAD-dependent oxidoreductase [Pseudomonas sp. DCB_E]MCX2889234.1 NAD(P)/FAD-dependent oxidoreductase [Pseudomonas sp. DCB_BI]MCX9142765.1 NAD(P)/FAD-dependent oxidoreductase [Pseudomonas sp. DCB_Q]
MSNSKEFDLVIVGAGPIGLYAAYYAGFRGLKTALFDGLPQVGGQVATMYPEKLIHDVAGFPAIKGSDFISNLLEQSRRQEYELHLGELVVDLVAEGDGYVLQTDLGETYHTKAVVLAAGLGKCTPRSLPALEGVHSSNVMHFISELSALDNKHVVIAGGGDSAVDWANAAAERAKSVTVIHRRARFRAHEASVKEMYKKGVRVIAPGEVVAYHEEQGLEFLEITGANNESKEIISFDKFIVALGFHSDLGPIAEWKINIDGFRIPVKEDMETNMPCIYAVGDVSEYPGKVRLIAVGFGEAAIAVNHAAAAISPEMSVLPGHSTNEVS